MIFFKCPITHSDLILAERGLTTNRGEYYAFFDRIKNVNVPVFTDPDFDDNKVSMYNHQESIAIYRNFLDWLFATFNEDEDCFRRKLINKLQVGKGCKVLITGCGLGDDIIPLLESVGLDGKIFATDISQEMIIHVSHRFENELAQTDRLNLAVCDAHHLPFSDDTFDAAFHFGGINLFSNVKQAIVEMDRVVKPGGRVVFGDEGVAPWLKNIEYGQIAITNNRLWENDSPIDLLPVNALDVNQSWILGNCFYLIDFEVSQTGPQMNIDIPHKGKRGGTMRTRYFGQIEGVSEKCKQFILADAEKSRLSVFEWLENLINEKRESNKNLS